MHWNYIILMIFCLVALIHILSIIKDNKTAEYITKPFLLPLLLLFYICSVSNPNYFIVFAITAGFLGDVFLMSSGSFFMAGLLSFLIGHVLYITAFLKPINFSSIPLLFFLLSLPYIVYGVLFFKKLFPYLKSEKIPTFIYLTCILIMSFASLMRFYSFTGFQFCLPFAGSLLFIASDFMLSLDTFQSAIKSRKVAMMITYILAQAMIVEGFVV